MSSTENTPTVDPEMAEAMRRMAEIAGDAPDRFSIPFDEGRRMQEVQRRPWNANPPELHGVDPVAFPGPFGDVPARIYRPAAGSGGPAVVYLHGGGWVFGSLDTHDKIMRLLALKSGRTVIGLDYALAPEHKFPDPVIETVSVFGHLKSRGADLGIDADRLALGGDSAGANVALAAAMDLRDRGGPYPDRCVLFYGVFDSDLDTESYRTFGGGEYGLRRSDMDQYWQAYQRGPLDRTNPLAAPVKGNLGNLPPLHLTAAGLDPLRDDTLRLADKLKAIDADYELLVLDGVCHGFLGLSDVVSKAHTALESAARFLNRGMS